MTPERYDQLCEWKPTTSSGCGVGDLASTSLPLDDQSPIERRSDMSIGPGLYEDVSARILEEESAQVVMVLVVNGARGTGFSVQIHSKDPIFDTLKCAAALRGVAESMESDARELRRRESAQ